MLHKLVKISYSCIGDIKKKLDSHNKIILSKEALHTDVNTYWVLRHYLTASVVYQANSRLRGRLYSLSSDIIPPFRLDLRCFFPHLLFSVIVSVCIFIQTKVSQHNNSCLFTYVATFFSEFFTVPWHSCPRLLQIATWLPVVKRRAFLPTDQPPSRGYGYLVKPVIQWQCILWNQYIMRKVLRNISFVWISKTANHSDLNVVTIYSPDIVGY